MERAAMDKTPQMASGKTEDAQTGKAGDQPRQMTQDAPGRRPQAGETQEAPRMGETPAITDWASI
ncbi:MAG: hypothetical protein KDD81_10570 [Rhodobacteraceae bacterium]|uniref:hypothetical protein n=2 Tax=Albidovulum sp. TaxID=1872424 RepID=UPI001D36C552|nr:hypothetical protein [Paracoccaceae bacterium]HPE25799.1 hypothetical protein [Albidovulum sp.]MCB2119363.1 hypothetical protein [Paracoccaceae bacterium]MCB2122986.1 hypothetical protein [Paracoccaceae bacterium]MCB2140398.1 hypothetical protein [Paracoccaceae bacterium]